MYTRDANDVGADTPGCLAEAGFRAQQDQRSRGADPGADRRRKQSPGRIRCALIGGAHGVDYAAIWSDLDGPEVRAAIAVFHPDGVPIRYLDGDVPMRFKLRRVPGEPVPASVLAAMKREPDEPWKVRDKMLAEMGWNPEPVPRAQYQAERLNRLFAEHGVTGQAAKSSRKRLSTA